LSEAAARIAEMEAARGSAAAAAEANAQRERELTERLRMGDTELTRVRAELEAALSAAQGGAKAIYLLRLNDM
jgi:hypothetical protein